MSRLKFPRLYCNRRFLDFVKMSVRFFEGRTMILPLRQRSWGRGPARRAVASEGGGKVARSTKIILDSHGRPK